MSMESIVSRSGEVDATLFTFERGLRKETGGQSKERV
jgi:hypothetical protein